ncbi:MAG: transposase [Verrucomicrobia bacterium]|nr:transposase [Verrucomicrobiota bacterium]
MNWAEYEFETIDLGDARLNRRVINIAQTLGLAPGRTIPQAFQSWAAIKASYNFFSNRSLSKFADISCYKRKSAW